MKLSELKAKQQQIEVEYRGEKLPFRYHPARFTPAVAESLQGADRPFSTSVKILSQLMADAGVTDDDDVLLPPTEEYIGQLPAALLDDILGAIFDDMKPGEANGATSPGGSLTAVK